MQDAGELDKVKSRSIKGAKTTGLVVDKKAVMMGGEEEPVVLDLIGNIKVISRLVLFEKSIS